MRRLGCLLLASLALGCVASCFVGCDKVPVRLNAGTFDFTAAHYFANEKTEYVFFSVAGLRAGQARLSWPSRFDLAVDASGTTTALNYQELDLTKAVFTHHLVECETGRLCGSYSFHTDNPPAALHLRFRYDVASSLSLETSVSNQVHADTETADAQSALIYGVFNRDNSRLQVRVHDNFGSPDSEQIKQFGMQRTFAVEGVTLSDLTAVDEASLLNSTGSSFLYPATPCSARLALTTSSSDAPVTISQVGGHEGWWPSALGSEDPGGQKRDACFKADTIDRVGHLVRSAPALARRNPVLLDETLSLRSPLRPARKVPIIVSYCDPAGGVAHTSPLFLDYQRYILGMADDAPVDVCFAVGKEAKFKQDFDAILTKRINAARAVGDGSDFIITLAINENLDVNITDFHQTIASELASRISTEIVMQSPRLVGAFVYDSQSVDDRHIALSSGLMWCPRQEADGGEGGGGVQGPNCAPHDSGQLKLGPFNFQIPMGPFPTLQSFVDYNAKYGDVGRAKNPAFTIAAVHTNPNSVTSGLGTTSGTIATFFDGERLTLQPGEHLKACPERDSQNLFEDLVFNVPSSTGTALVDATTLEATVDGASTPPASVAVGLRWQDPFAGFLSYDLPVTGRVFDLIPLSKSFGAQQAVGEDKWRRATWPVGSLLQKCIRNCDHPYFDEAGVYQLSVPWNNADHCVQPVVVEPPQ